MTSSSRTLTQRAVALLARREHSRAELVRKLAPHAGPDDDLDALLDGLEAGGLQSDRRYAEQVAHQALRRHGSMRVEQRLRLSGVSGDTLEGALDTARAREPEAALAVLRRRFTEAPATREAWAAQARYLHNRGFRPEVIHQVLRGRGDEESPA